MKPVTSNHAESPDMMGDDEFRRGVYLAVLLLMLMPPALGSILMGIAGFYPMPEIFLIFTSYSLWYVLITVALGMIFAKWASGALIGLAHGEHSDREKIARRILRPLPVYLFIFLCLLSTGGAITANLSLENIGVDHYALSDHLFAIAGLMPVVLIVAFPIYFYFTDYLGRYLAPRGINIVASPMAVKLLMLGLVTPVLIDIILISYFNNRFGLFNWQIIGLWFALIVVAAIGTYLAWLSFRQSLNPLRNLYIVAQDNLRPSDLRATRPQSLDELGVVTSYLRDAMEGCDHARDGLRSERGFLNAVLETAGALILVLDREGRIYRFNRACEELSGYRFAEVEGKFPWDMVLPPEDAETIRIRAFEALANNPEAMAGRYTNYWLSRHGDRYLIDWYNTLLLDADGKMNYMISVGVDITEKHAMEAALKHSQETSRRAEAMAHIGTWEWDIPTNGLTWSDEFNRIFGLSPQSQNQDYDTFMGVIHPDDREIHQRAIRSSVRDRNVPYDIAHRLLLPTGEVRYVHARGEVYRNEEGKAVRMIGTVLDVTEQKRVEQELRRHQEHLEELVEERASKLMESEKQLRQAHMIARLGHWSLFVQSGELHWSDEIFRIFGYAPQSVMPTQDFFFKIVHPDDLDRVIEHSNTAFQESGLFRIDHRIVLPDGDIRWVHEEAVTEKDAHGQPYRMTGTVQDITERKYAEEALIRAREEAERANQAKSEFLSRMSHELRTPLNAILGFAQVLELESLPQQHKEYVDEIFHAGNHLLDLINELLDLTRIESGKLSMTYTAVPVLPVLQQALAIVQPLLNKKELSLRLECADELSVYADQTRIKQVLVNLLNNAAKYNRQGGEIKVHCSDIHDRRMKLMITDTGSGIAEQDMAKLFVSFERLGADAKGIEGTGIGLVLCKHLIEMMGGRIGVESEAGVGSTFWIELPVAEAEAISRSAPLNM